MSPGTPACPSRGPLPTLARTVCAFVLAGALLSGCDDSSPQHEAATSQSPSASTPSSETTQTPPPVATRRLDSIAVLGHSGATGTMTDPKDATRDAHENSWATGVNPKVDSIYRRLLAEHPAMRGHNYNLAVNGTDVDALDSEFDDLLATADVLPDIVLIQTIDNDMRCDGTDQDNYRPFGESLDRVLTRIEDTIPHVAFFIVSQWATVDEWTAWAAHHDEQVLANTGTGPCQVFDGHGDPRPAGIRSMQRIVDSYWAVTEQVCAEHRHCFTDGGAESRLFIPTDQDIAPDLNHLSIEGHRKFAAIAWKAFPESIKQRS